MKDNHFKVRIQCMTYNHAPYIVDAMNGFCMQQTDFPFLAVVVDDASTDGEPEVIKNYLEEHFDKEMLDLPTPDETDEYVRVFARHKENKNCYFLVLFLKYNHYSLKKAKLTSVADLIRPIPYLAMCEGDDYWIDSSKLQRQVEILEADVSLMAVVTNSCQVDKEKNLLLSEFDKVVPNNKEGRYDLRSFINNNHRYPTATVCYRRAHAEEISAKMKRMSNGYYGDWPLWVCLHLYGDFFYLDCVTSAYRINPTSVTHTYDRIGRAKVDWKVNKALHDILPDEYDDIRKATKKTTWIWINLGHAYGHERKYLPMSCCFLVAFFKNPKELMGYFRRRRNKTATS